MGRVREGVLAGRESAGGGGKTRAASGRRRFRQAFATLRLAYSGDGLKEKSDKPNGDIFS